MKTIWKFELPLQEDFELEMPKGWQKNLVSTVLVQGEQKGFLWAEVDSEAEKRKYKFKTIGTGREIPPDVDDGKVYQFWFYIGTYFSHGNLFVWHIYCYEDGSDE